MCRWLVIDGYSMEKRSSEINFHLTKGKKEKVEKSP
jgi:hypothetical protein